MLAALERGLQKRWSTLLDLSEQPHQIHYTAAALKAKTLETFKTSPSKWVAAQYYAPDLMIAAANVDAICDGNYHWVLGELHPAVNTLISAGLVAQHPAPQELFEAHNADCPAPQVKLAAAREKVTALRATALVKPTDYRFMVANDACGAPWGQNLLAGELVVEERDGDLIVHGRTGQPQFEIIEFLSDVVAMEILHHFHFLPATMRHLPRISIDRLIVHRETWQFTATEMSFAFTKDGGERFLQMRSWAQVAGLPRFLFVKIPHEPKPFFVDLASPILVELFAKVVRQIQKQESSEAFIRVTEMLPAPDQCWLEDNIGRCVSELRMIIVDRNPG
jgi:hypothetical protein